MTIIFEGKAGVDRYRAAALIAGLRLYQRSGIKPNSAWTPTAMLALASHYTGKQYKRGQYLDAIADMKEWINAQQH